MTVKSRDGIQLNTAGLCRHLHFHNLPHLYFSPNSIVGVSSTKRNSIIIILGIYNKISSHYFFAFGKRTVGYCFAAGTWNEFTARE